MSLSPAASSACTGADARPAGVQVRFPHAERRLLLSERGIGPTVLVRLEQAGYCSLAQLERVGPTQVAMDICTAVGSNAWANRIRPLERALRRAGGNVQ